ncbi:hypothetical protein ACHAWF_010987 [Thalassiosira exigua]
MSDSSSSSSSAAAAPTPPPPPRPVVICGPSGVGKGTLIELLRTSFPPDAFGFSVSHTTRKPRDGEEDGVHYHFAKVDDMKQEIDAGKFVEHAEVHGNYYGTRFLGSANCLASRSEPALEGAGSPSSSHVVAPTADEGAARSRSEPPSLGSARSPSSSDVVAQTAEEGAARSRSEPPSLGSAGTSSSAEVPVSTAGVGAARLSSVEVGAALGSAGSS